MSEGEGANQLVLPGKEEGQKRPWRSFGMSTPSNSTLAISSKFLASSTRRNGDLPTAVWRTDERMIPACVNMFQLKWCKWQKSVYYTKKRTNIMIVGVK